MKFSGVLSVLALLATGSLASPASSAEAECGDLGVMNINYADIPDGIDPSQIRRCADHPLGRTPLDAPEDTTKLEKREGDLVNLKPRACYYAAEFGCSGGYCWKQCGLLNSGAWCWTAQLAGLGDWIRCTETAQCNQLQACGIGNCGACGCGC